MKINPVKRLQELGQSVWLDFLRRDLITSGKLKKYIEEDGVQGITTNFAHFEKALIESHDYDEDIRKMITAGKDTKTIHETIVLQDAQLAADKFRPVYDKTNGQDGYVSIAINPNLAHDAQGTIVEARRLWAAVNRPNIFIKVPSTSEGRTALQQLISEGINVNATLIFGLHSYRQVVDAYHAGIEARLGQGMPVDHVSSVATFNLSNIDELFDPILKKLIKDGGELAELAVKMQGQIAIALAKAAYQIFKEVVDSTRVERLVDKGASPQRLLWTGLSTKNQKISNVKYVDSLIGPHTIITFSDETLQTYRDRGDPQVRIEQDAEQAYWIVDQLSKLGANIDIMSQQLECKGLEKFDQSYDKLMTTLEKISSRLSAK
jgi:transaldolase